MMHKEVTLFLVVLTVCLSLTVIEAREPGDGKSYFDVLAEFHESVHYLTDPKPNDALNEDFHKLFTKLYSEWNSLNANSRDKLLGGQQSSKALYLNRSTPTLNSILQVLETADASDRCINDTGRFIIDLIEGKSWALAFLDAAGKPTPSLLLQRYFFVGDYKECRSISAPAAPEIGSVAFRGNYCPVSIYLAKGMVLFSQLIGQIGLCLPDTCTDTEITTIIWELKLKFNITALSPVAQCHTDEREYTTASVLAIVFLSVIGGMMILGTAFDILSIQRPKWASQKSGLEGLITNAEEQVANSYHPISDQDVSHNEATPLMPNGNQKTAQDNEGRMAKVLVAFSVYTNGAKVLNTTQPKGSLGAINGIRFLSMSWVILGHTYVFGMNYFENKDDLLTLLNDWTFDAISNALVSVDTFFTLSGLLTAYITIKEMKKSSWKINWGLFYFHRFWRLTPPYMLSLLLVLGLQRFMGSGSEWDMTQPMDKVNCEGYWWTNFLYINNLVDAKKMCFGHSWYLANDMQFFVLSPLMLIPFYFNTYFGLLSCSVLLLTSWITTGVLSTTHGWPASLVSGKQPIDVTSYFFDYYVTPWCRIGPFLVGMMTGYLLAITNGKVRLNRYLNLVGWAVATATGLACVYGLRGDISGAHPSTVGVNALYNAVARSAWGASVCWVIVSCVSGYGGFVNTILSWSPFVTLGRLTYMSYLIHPCILNIYYGNMERLLYVTTSSMVIVFLGILLLVNMVAFVLMLGLESPMIGLEKIFLPRRRP